MSCCLVLFAPRESTFINRVKKFSVRTELSSQGRAKYKSSSAWRDGFRSAWQGRASHTPLFSHHSIFILILTLFVLEHWSSCPVLVSEPNTKSVQRTQVLLVPLYFSVRSLPVIAFCKAIHILACTKNIWKATILLQHSFYHKPLARFENTVPCYSHCASMRHGFTRCSGASWSSAWLHGSPRTLLALLSLSMILALMSAMADVCAWGFCLLQYLLRYFDILSMFLEIFWHPPPPTIWYWHPQARQIASRAYLLIQHYLNNHSAHKELHSQLPSCVFWMLSVQGLFVIPKRSAWHHWLQ